MFSLKKKKEMEVPITTEEGGDTDSMNEDVILSKAQNTLGVSGCVTEGDITTVVLYGKIEVTTFEDCLKYLLDKLESVKTEEFHVDIEKIVYISSSGLRIFQELSKKAKEKNIVFKVVNVTENVYQMFKMTGYNASIKLVPVTEE